METRILMLHQAKLIDECTKDYLSHVVSQLQAKGLDKESDDMARMITHFAMAISRQQKFEVVDEMDSFLFEEIKNNEHYEQAKTIWCEIKENIPVEFSENEVRFMMLHLSTLVGSEQK